MFDHEHTHTFWRELLNVNNRKKAAWCLYLITYNHQMTSANCISKHLFYSCRGCIISDHSALQFDAISSLTVISISKIFHPLFFGAKTVWAAAAEPRAKSWFPVCVTSAGNRRRSDGSQTRVHLVNPFCFLFVNLNFTKKKSSSTQINLFTGVKVALPHGQTSKSC